MSEPMQKKAGDAERLRVLREAFAEQLPSRLEKIEAAWRAVQESAANVETVRSLQHKVRSLAGSSAVFGFDLLGDSARRLELLLKSAAVGFKRLGDEHRERIGAGLEELKQACLEFAQGGVADLLDPEALGLQPGRERASPVIFLLSSDPRLSAYLGFELGCFGLLVRRVTNFSHLRESLEQTVPSAIMVDAEPFDQRIGEAAQINEIRRHRELSIPLFMLASRSDLASRLRSVEAGGDAYFLKPLESRKLIEALELETERPGAEPYRILILEEDYTAGLDFSLALQRSGMEACLLTQPTELWQSMIEFRPELILMSLPLAGVNGLHLASVIRQQDTYANVPIIVLLAESGLGQHVEAMHSKVNDILTTPVPPELLFSVVSNHVQQARTLNRFISSDSLTGLLNHTRFLERLVLEVDRAQQEGSRLAFGLLDIDHLDAVNETFGHLSGDSVLRSLGRLLQQRLRRADVLGRYGGDEFAIVMPETSGDNAVKVIEGVRSVYAELQHQSGDDSFCPTFCCGIAAWPGYEDSAGLRQAAVSALQSAKREGGNRVVLAKRPSTG